MAIKKSTPNIAGSFESGPFLLFIIQKRRRHLIEKILENKTRFAVNWCSFLVQSLPGGQAAL